MRELIVAAVTAIALCSTLAVSAAPPAKTAPTKAAPAKAVVPCPPTVPGKDEKCAMEVIAELTAKKHIGLYFLEYEDEGWVAKKRSGSMEVELKVNTKTLKTHVESKDECEDLPPAKDEKSMEDIAKLAMTKHPDGAIVSMEYDNAEWEVEMVVGGKTLILTYSAKNGELLDEY